MARLGDVCKKASSNIAQKDLKDQAGSYPIYGAGGFIAGVNFYHREEPYIAVVKDGAGVGRVMKLPAKSSVIGTMQYILPNPGVDAGYLAYAMEHMNLGRYYTGTTIPHIYFKDYQREELALPALSRQREIAAALDKLSDNMDLRRRQFAKLDELVKARFVEMFGDLGINPRMWSEIPLSSGCSSPDDIKCGPFGTQLNKEEYQTTGNRFLQGETSISPLNIDGLVSDSYLLNKLIHDDSPVIIVKLLPTVEAFRQLDHVMSWC